MFNLDLFVSENYDSIFRLALSKNLSSHDAEDLTQSVMLDFCEKARANRLDVEQNPRAYLYKLANWRILDRHDRNNYLQKFYEPVGEFNDLDTLPLSKKDKRENQELIYEAFKLVEGSSRDLGIFKSLIFQGKSAKQTANLFKTSNFTVHMAKHRIGKKVIRAAKFLNNYGI